MHRLSYAFLIGFLCVAFTLQWYQRAEYTVLLSILLALIALLLALRALRTASAVVGCGIALICVARTTHIQTPASIDYYADGSKQTHVGTIVDEPDRRPLHTKYTVQVKGTDGYVLVSDYQNWPRYHYGDRIEIHGKLERPKAIERFRYDKYLSRYNIYAVIYRGSIGLLEEGAHSPKRTLYAVKEWFEQRINMLYPEPHASFMAGLLTGSRKGIPDTLMEAFNTTGLTHIIAISGYNITIVIALISGMFFWMNPVRRIIPSVAAIIVFTIFVGASAAVVRAAIMGILGLVALQCGRVANVRLGVLWTAGLMIAWNPKVLWYDAGFQLSFLAVIGLIELSPLLDPLCNKLPTALAIRESLQMTIAAQLSAVPLIILLFQRFSLIAPVANLLIAPFIPLAMLFGAVGTLVSTLHFPLGQIIGYLGWGCLEWIIQVANTLSAIPFASVTLAVSAWVLPVYYGLLIVTTYTASGSFGRRSKEQAAS